MGLQISFNDAFGHTDATAYASVTDTHNNRSEPYFEAQVSVYKDEAAKTAGNPPMKTYSYLWDGASYAPLFAPAVIDVAGMNETKAVYNEIKGDTDTYPEWTGAIDIGES